jgi:type VI secretion system (T6SS) effector TldE1-like protein
MWTYEQASGRLSKDGIQIATGYSGFGDGKNNPRFEATPDVGPICCGLWEICGPPYTTAEHGPYVLRLEPDSATYGRTGFLMHGDSIEHPGQASKGCIIMDRVTRARVYQSGDTKLMVVSGVVVADPEISV